MIVGLFDHLRKHNVVRSYRKKKIQLLDKTDLSSSQDFQFLELFVFIHPLHCWIRCANEHQNSCINAPR